MTPQAGVVTPTRKFPGAKPDWTRAPGAGSSCEERVPHCLRAWNKGNGWVWLRRKSAALLSGLKRFDHEGAQTLNPKPDTLPLGSHGLLAKWESPAAAPALAQCGCCSVVPRTRPGAKNPWFSPRANAASGRVRSTISPRISRLRDRVA